MIQWSDLMLSFRDLYCHISLKHEKYSGTHFKPRIAYQTVKVVFDKLWVTLKYLSSVFTPFSPNLLLF